MKDSYQIEEIHRAINKWFKIMDYEKWAKSYPVEFSSLSAQRLLQHFSWCDSNGINFTPSIIVQNWLKPTILDVNVENTEPLTTLFRALLSIQFYNKKSKVDIIIRYFMWSKCYGMHGHWFLKPGG